MLIYNYFEKLQSAKMSDIFKRMFMTGSPGWESDLDYWARTPGTNFQAGVTTGNFPCYGKKVDIPGEEPFQFTSF